MKRYKGGVRHDYKDLYLTSPALRRKRHWSMFVLGLALPVVTVALLLTSERNESKIPAAKETVLSVDGLTQIAIDLPPAAGLPISGVPSADSPAAPGADESVMAAAGAVASSAAAGTKASASTETGAAVQPAAAGQPAGPPTPASARARPTATAERRTAAVIRPRAAATAISSLASTPLAAFHAGPDPIYGFFASMLELVVKPGDSLERLFRRNGLSLSDLAEMVRLRDVAEHLKLLKPGDTIHIAHRDGQVLSMLRPLDRVRMLSIERAGDGFDAQTVELPLDIGEQVAHAQIRTSLFEAGTAAGMSDSLTMTMAGIFQWDIDFIQDVRVGDTFTVIYEEHYRDGEKLGDGPIIAAEFVNRGKIFRAARYTDASGRSDYFTPDGRSVRKAFLRAPVDFTRISSNFDLNRRHPVLNTIRAHRGVDYAAPTGTPVMAAGDGKIISRGVNGGYGNAVILEHGGNITTLYAHLSRFGQHKAGSRVKQGDIIGYVGATGLATGPHLHYEYRVDGAHRNPRTVPLPPADPIPEGLRADFDSTVAVLWERLDQISAPRYADASTNP